MTLLWCIAILAPSFFSIKMSARSSRHCEYPDQSRGSHFTMLTPRENLDVDSEDSEPAPHRHSGFRVVAEGGLQLSQFLTRISNKRSSEIRVYSFQSRKPLPMSTKMGDLPLKMSIQIWSEDLAKPSKTAWNPAMWRAPTRTMPRITKSSSSGIFPHGNFSTVVRQTGLNKIVAFNNSPTRWTVSAPGWRTWSGPKALDEGGLPHDRRAIFPFGSASKGARPALLCLWVADLWQSRFTAVPRLGNEGFQNFHLQFIGRYNYSWATFWTTASCVLVYNWMWQSYSWTFSFTIACGNITVGLCFERRLPAFPFTIACGRAVLLSGVSRFSRKPSRELLWKTDSRGH